MTCSAPDCRRIAGVLNFPAPDDGFRPVCRRHRTDADHALVVALDARAARVGIAADRWPYGPNIDVAARVRLLDWAEATGYRYAEPPQSCVHWVLGRVRRCRALRDYDHPGRIVDESYRALDHLTHWTRDGAPALILGQPYRSPKAAWMERMTAEWPVDVAVTDTGPWYGHGAVGVLLTPTAGTWASDQAAEPATWPEIGAVLARHGGRLSEGRGTTRRTWSIPTPGAGYVRVSVALRSRWCSVTVDRLPCAVRRPEGAAAWMRAHLGPVLRRSIERRGRGAGLLSTGESWGHVDPVDRTELVALLELWLAQEAVWTAEASR